MKTSYWNYIPIVFVIALGFFIGGGLSFGISFLGLFPFIEDQVARKILTLFGIGMLGATTYCSRFWSKDIDDVVYESPEYLPHVLDFVGYITLILGGGLTGVISYFLIKTGIGVSTTSNSTSIQISGEASVIISYIGGLYHFRVQRHSGTIIDKVFAETKKEEEHD